MSEKIEPISAGNHEIMALLLFKLSCFRSSSVSHEYFDFDMKLINSTFNGDQLKLN